MIEYKDIKQSNFTTEIFTKENRPSKKEVEQVAVLFAKVFAGEPWNEVNKCDECEILSGPDVLTGHTCSDCKRGTLGEAYPFKETVDMINETSEKGGFRMVLLSDNNNIVGFAWGHLRNVEEYYEKFDKYSSESKELLKIFFNGAKQFFSLAEIGLDDDYRGKGFGKILVQTMVNEARAYNSPVAVWTGSDAILTPICLKEGFLQTFGPKVFLNNGKIIMTGQNVSGSDKTTPERVLFVKNF